MAEKSLREIALECVGDRIKDVGRSEHCLDEVGLIRYAISHNVSFAGLLNTINGISINNERNGFEERVINPIKRVQGIYY